MADKVTTMAAGSEKDYYRDPLIAMAFFAVLFFIILVVILAIWCKARRQTEVKTVVIQPKRKPVPTKVVRESNGGNQPTNGNIDIEAGPISTDEIELSDDQEETHISVEKQTEVADQDKAEDSAAAAASLDDSDWHVVDKGQTNPSFEKDVDDEVPAS